MIIERGAEAIIVRKGNLILKRRVSKSYRFKKIDERIRKQRTKRELNILEKLFGLIPVPRVINDGDNEIGMEYIEGKKLSEALDSLDNSEEICKMIGIQIAKIHNEGIVHGDLTTSNMILSDNKILSKSEDGFSLYFIDFGLSFHSDRDEDKAVDLHLIKEALEAKHFKNFDRFFEKVLEGYKISKDYKKILNKLKKVESRGRYK